MLHNHIDENGILTGVRCLPYCYSGRTVVGIKAYELHKTEELNCVLPLKTNGEDLDMVIKRNTVVIGKLNLKKMWIKIFVVSQN